MQKAVAKNLAVYDKMAGLEAAADVASAVRGDAANAICGMIK